MSHIDTRHWQNGRSAPQRPTGERAADCRSNLEKYFGKSAQSDQIAQATREKRERPRISARWRHCLSEVSPRARER
jgi:hypothetical protein